MATAKNKILIMEFCKALQNLLNILPGDGTNMKRLLFLLYDNGAKTYVGFQELGCASGLLNPYYNLFLRQLVKLKASEAKQSTDTPSFMKVLV
jgi:hypothetical protein